MYFDMSTTRRRPPTIPGPNEELGRLARAAIGGLSTRAARIKIEHGLRAYPLLAQHGAPSKSTINNLSNGMTVDSISLETFAIGLGVDPAPLFEAMGRLYRPSDPSYQSPTEALPRDRIGESAAPYALANDPLATFTDPLAQIGPDVDTSLLDKIPMFGSGNVASQLPVDRAILVSGDALAPHYYPGDIVFVDTLRQPEPGDEVIATVDMTDLACFVIGETDLSPERYRVWGIVQGHYRPRKRRG